jgi:deoxyguanosine kinase
MAIRYLVIEGNIGAGKTSLCNIINKNYSCKLVLEEFESNPFLEKFYKDPKRYAFSVELAFLSERYNQIKNQLENYDLFKVGSKNSFF